MDFILRWFAKGRALLELVPDTQTFALAVLVYLAKHKADPEAQELINKGRALVDKAESIITVKVKTAKDMRDE